MNWCRDYLSNREQRVAIDGKSSDWRSIPSGVPQVSLLGPLFFVIFKNDLPDAVSPTSLVALYADDCKTSRAIQHPCDHESLQYDLNSLVSWSRLNHMSFKSGSQDCENCVLLGPRVRKGLKTFFDRVRPPDYC